MKELFRISTLLEGPSLGKLPKIKLPKEVTTELILFIQKFSKLVDVTLDKEIEKTNKQ